MSKVTRRLPSGVFVRFGLNFPNFERTWAFLHKMAQRKFWQQSSSLFQLFFVPQTWNGTNVFGGSGTPPGSTRDSVGFAVFSFDCPVGGPRIWSRYLGGRLHETCALLGTVSRKMLAIVNYLSQVGEMQSVDTMYQKQNCSRESWLSRTGRKSTSGVWWFQGEPRISPRKLVNPKFCAACMCSMMRSNKLVPAGLFLIFWGWGWGRPPSRIRWKNGYITHARRTKKPRTWIPRINNVRNFLIESFMATCMKALHRVQSVCSLQLTPTLRWDAIGYWETLVSNIHWTEACI